jgi:hypothetical protein
MKTKLILIQLFCSSIMFSQGVLWDESSDSILTSLFPERTENSRSVIDLPPSYSLEKYCPISDVNEQYGLMCVAYSLATARTILYAKNKSLTDKREISHQSFSPYYIYYNTKSEGDTDCNLGLYPKEALKFVALNGFAQLSMVEYQLYHPYTDQILCATEEGSRYYPPNISSDEKNAEDFKIDAITKVTNISDIKRELSSGSPVFFLVYFPNSWNIHGLSKSDYWDSKTKYRCGGTTTRNERCKNPTTNNCGACNYHKDQFKVCGGRHAMLIVGYDDKEYGGSFRIFNSYGKEWGENGFMWIKYEELLYNDDLGFIGLSLTKNKENSSRSIVNKQENSSKINFFEDDQKFDPESPWESPWE